MTSTYKISGTSSYIDNIPVFTLSGVESFSVEKTFDCGQCFRFEPVTGSRHETEYAGVAHGRLVSFAQDGDRLTIYNATEADFDKIWCRYLGLDRDYGEINADILSRSSTPALCEAVSVGGGIRILRQDAWETVCSFIISQNNNIPRIKKIVGALCREYGEPIDVCGMEKHGGEGGAWSFPDAETVLRAGLDGMLALKTGFRAKYIIDAAQKCVDGRLALDELPDIQTDAAREMLKSVKGIGDKVAACSLLFGFGHLDAFPIDVWIKRVIARYFGEDFSADSLGPYAGVAQQYLFYYERWHGGEAK